MNKKKKNKIFLLLILLLGVTVGFAALATTLKINGNAGIGKNSWNIYWDSIGNEDGVTPETATEIVDEDTTHKKNIVTFDITFDKPGDFYEFQVDAVNAGTIDAEILEIESKYNDAVISQENPLPSYLKYSVKYADGSDVTVGDKLAKRTSTTEFTRKRYKIRVEYDKDAVTISDVNNQDGDVTHSFSFKVVYGQSSPSAGGNKVSPKINDNPIAGLTTPEIKDLIGEEVTDVDTEKNSDWELFYVDDNYIYLITKDYIRVNNLPNELAKQTGDSDSTPKYLATFGTQTSVGSDSTVQGDIVDHAPWNAGNASTTLSSNPITSTYLKWVAANTSSVGDGAQVLAYMMDTNVWKDFAGDIDGAFAMGGPTVEMFALSYNEKHITNIATYSAINSDNADQFGYNVKMSDSGSWSNDLTGLDHATSNMWIKTDASKAPAYWLASPASNYSADVSGTSDQKFLSVWANGRLGYQYMDFANNNYVGFRPLLAIPKSSLE